MPIVRRPELLRFTGLLLSLNLFLPGTATAQDEPPGTGILRE